MKSLEGWGDARSWRVLGVPVELVVEELDEVGADLLDVVTDVPLSARLTRICTEPAVLFYEAEARRNLKGLLAKSIAVRRRSVPMKAPDDPLVEEPDEVPRSQVHYENSECTSRPPQIYC
eukprot:3318015-Amphidinium_carterae.1